VNSKVTGCFAEGAIEAAIDMAGRK
jgi:hypothetical protein